MSSSILKAALAKNLLSPEEPWAVFYDLDRFESRLKRLVQAFPPGTHHAVAVKANPLLYLLELIVASGAGLEAASYGEVALSQAAGATKEQIVFDSPAKTLPEIERALHNGHYLNVDNFTELERVASLGPPTGCRVGLRVNPEVGAGTIAETSVATRDSKFGVPLLSNETEIIDAFRRHPWLQGLHVHTGSQGCGLKLLVEGVRRTVALAEAINCTVGSPQVRTIDIGGGLSVPLRPDDESLEIEDYARALRQEVPALFDFELITEFGRWLHAPCAFAASRIEYVKETPEQTIATIHFGADLLLRRAYRPEQWYHRIELFDCDGRILPNDQSPLTVAGPLCFAGDLIARGEPLGRPSPGDIVVAFDVGAYTFSMWSRYCSRPFPRIFGARRSVRGIEFELLHGGEAPQDLVRFWG